MLTWKHVRDIKREEYEQAADGWGKVSASASAAMDQVDQQMIAKLQKSQRGKAARAAVRDLGRLSRNYQYIHTECGLIRTALNGFATELATPQRKVNEALAAAEGYKFTVNPDGSVEYPQSPLTPLGPGTGTATPGAPVPLLPGKGEGGADVNKGRAEEIAEKLANAVREAAEIQSRYKAALGKLKSEGGLEISARMWADAAKDIGEVRKAAGNYVTAGSADIPKNKTPAENAIWWQSLRQEKRDELATMYPASIGALDGLPSEVRDEANRIVLRTTTADLELERAALVAQRDELSQYDRYRLQKAKQRIKEIDEDLKGLNSVQNHLDTAGQKDLPELYLLGVDTEKEGHAIVSGGNPDTADNVATYVPGMNTNLEGIDKDIQRAENLYSESVKLGDPDKKYASLMWLDYDAPQGPSVGSENRANKGAPVLHDFLDGLQASHPCPPANDTVIGHSYGSLVTGKMLASDETPPVDAAIFIGSPGVGVDNARDLNIPPEAVWAGKSKNDPVAHLPTRTPWDPRDWGKRPFGVDPTSFDFGGNSFGVQDGSKWPPFSAHSLYWDENSESLGNMALLVNGEWPASGMDPE
ncbi:alpha/beta hydrolase family protein [Streptomyces sp. NBC_00210]|uniref:alpha/beta hydrolase n=1 Tax=unclassified Streptomyces TaxID=2593676 RepID=UPI00324807F5